MKLNLKKNVQNIVGVVMLVAVLLAVAFTSHSNKGQEVEVKKEIGLLQTVRERGYIICGVNAGLPGFSAQDEDTGVWSGLDVDFCKAVSAAIFGDETKVEFVGLNAMLCSEHIYIQNTGWYAMPY